MARETGADRLLVARQLSGQMVPLYYGMSRGDRSHARSVLRALCWQGLVPPALAQAALLHDVGKASARLTLIHRVVFVLLTAWARSLSERLASSPTSCWRHAFYVQWHHAELGASRCAQAGCSPLVVELVRRHEPTEPTTGLSQKACDMLQALRRADEGC